ncbi:glycosyltransferase family 4 protein [Leptolyngbya sp. FACHB-36]|uniref:glycosyltransferase family 4 protein n=1 Tax=Leptolyngbya sp. FACHB-36 TaxID=2692808 RepID=UPI0016814BED|nr:glycosyltransferase [Leptolyngbya sp. FACHB-36]MBD2020132.1 glycosyltransferase family 4 protein [Leptolyngbya sp. FACHB-36]
MPIPRVLIVAEHASAQFGGEAALPLHYFRVLRQRGIPVWLMVHERTREELTARFAEEVDRLYFVPDTALHRWLWQLSKPLPSRLSYFTVGFVLRLITQLVQRRLIKQVIQTHQISVIHQPMPVSPKEPSMIFGMGVPVVIGPMNGGMDYPPAFRQMQSRLTQLTVAAGRQFSNLLNLLMPGKRQAAVLLVANQRTEAALPSGLSGQVIQLVENGVDLSVWKPEPSLQPQQDDCPTQFVFIGRLVDWKAVDLLLSAVRQVTVPIALDIIGEGVERAALEQQAAELGLSSIVQFAGWLSQADCAQRLEQADALVLPSLMECGGAVVLEAMAMGKPAIATNWGGPADYLDASCGILVEPTSRQDFIDGLAAAMTQLATSPDLRRSMGQAGRQRVLDRFDWEVKGTTILEVYQQAISDSASQSSASQPLTAT